MNEKENEQNLNKQTINNNKQFNKQTINSLISNFSIMKKTFIFAAFAASVLAVGCVKSEVVQNVTQGDNAVSFGVYVPKAVTKAGSTTLLNANSDLQTVGFGVFAAYSDGAPGAYNASTSPMNFMWNQQVTYAGSAWSYSPTKYWPNEHGAAANSSTNVDKLSFFAYAPYVAATAADGTIASDNTWGITGFSNATGAGNTGTGDPKVHYTCNSEYPVDLVWGVINSSGNWTDSEGTNLPLTAGMPYLNLIKPKDNPTINLKFHHALAKFVVDVKAVESGAGTSNISIADDGENATGTRIYIESLTVTGTNIYTTGKLNLNNTTAGVPLWEVTGAAGTTLPLDITTSNLYIASTPTAWDNTGWKKATKPGVLTGEYTDLVSGMVIPNYGSSPETHASVTSVTIVYDVITKDPNLDGNASIIKNTITKNISAAGLSAGFNSITNGNIYRLHLILGMKTVDIEAEVEAWTDSISEEVYLPQNVVTP